MNILHIYIYYIYIIYIIFMKVVYGLGKIFHEKLCFPLVPSTEYIYIYI